MDEKLNGLTDDEIRNLAKKQLELQNQEQEELELKIVSMDKEFKKEKSNVITKAIYNGMFVALMSYLVLTSESQISDFETTNLIDSAQNLADNLTTAFQNIPTFEIATVILSKGIEGINYIIEKVGIMGYVLANRSINLVLGTVKNSIKVNKIKREIDELKKIIEGKRTKC